MFTAMKIVITAIKDWIWITVMTSMSVVFPYSPNPYASGGSPVPVTANDIINKGINLFALNGKRIPLVNYNCTPHYYGDINPDVVYMVTHWFDTPIPISSNSIATTFLTNMFPVPQILTYNLVKNTPLNTSLTTPQVINSMLLSTNGLDVYMGER